MSTIIFGILLVLVFVFVLMYNGLVTMRNRVKNAWAQIDVQLKRRYNLIPNLVETVKGYATHEKTVFENVTKARSAAINASGVGDQAQAENMLSGALKSLFAVSENYPQLKASQNFMMLQEELAGTENKIAYSRQFYNDSVMLFNTKIQHIPYNIIANLFGFKEENLFEISIAAEKETPKVKF